MQTFLTIAGGVALILFGVRFLRKGLDRIFGPKLDRWVQGLVNGQVRAWLFGVGLSVLVPSSTTVSILSVQAVQAGTLSARQMMAVMLGANIGLTAMVWVIALRVEQYAPILLLAGVGLFQFTSSSRLRGTGQIVLSLGFILSAITIIKESAVAIDPGGDLIKVLEIAVKHPVGLALFSALLAVVLQSSTATIGLVIGLAVADRADLGLAVPVVVGANVGIAITTLLFGWTQIESRRLALANLMAVVVTAVAATAMLPLGVVWVLDSVLGGLEKQIAVAHTGFNVLVTILFLPLVGPVASGVRRFVPDPVDSGSQSFGPKYLTAVPVEAGSLALGQSLREILRVSEIVRGMLSDLWSALSDRDATLAEQVQLRDDEVDLLDTEIKRFLAGLPSGESGQDERGEAMRQLHYLIELETIGDVIDKNLAELAIKRARQDIEFSLEGWGELEDFYHKVSENLLIAETAFTMRDQMLARQLIRHKQRLNEYERELRDRHWDRLRKGLRQSHESSAVHLDLLTHLKRINSCVTHVAYAIVQGDGGQP